MPNDTRKFIKELPKGKFRDSTPEEIELALAAEKHRKMLENRMAATQKALEELKTSCTHPVVYDEQPTGPCCGGYVSRICVVCGNISLL